MKFNDYKFRSLICNIFRSLICNIKQPANSDKTKITKRPALSRKCTVQVLNSCPTLQPEIRVQGSLNAVPLIEAFAVLGRAKGNSTMG